MELQFSAFSQIDNFHLSNLGGCKLTAVGLAWSFQTQLEAGGHRVSKTGLGVVGCQLYFPEILRSLYNQFTSKQVWGCGWSFYMLADLYITL